MDITRSEIYPSINKLTLFQRYFHKWMYAGLFASDIFSLSLSLGAGVLIRENMLGPGGAWDAYQSILPELLALAVLIYAFQGLYVLSGIDPVHEIRTLSFGTCLTFLILTAFTFFTQTSLQYSRFTFVLTWSLSLLIVPTSRFILRVFANKLNIWGEPVIIFSNQTTAKKMIDFINNKSQLGWKPIAVIGINPEQQKFQSNQIPYYIVDTEIGPEQYLNFYKTKTLIVVQNEIPNKWVNDLHKPSNQHIRKVVIIPSIENVQSTIVKTHNIAGSLGLELQQNLLSPWGRFFKHAIDTFISLGIGIFILPIVGILALLIRIDSKGKAFYAQTRIGFGGKPFKVWKFRTMVENADQILQEYLEKNPDSRKEWAETQKLKDDPRITRVGNFLRKLSLDELPQIWNILRGEMSMVGPRPCMPEQMSLYGEITDLYQCVRPGITGLWQVSGRNNTTFEERIYFDGYYVKNWSMWLDIYILIKTVWVVISRDGAY